jgi:retinol dehydrogenase-12
MVRLGAAPVVFAVRSLPKGEAAKADILKTNPTSKTKVELWHLDMESYDSVLAFGKLAQELPRLDIAMLSAACFKYEFETSPSTGNESSMQVNHLSTALLSLLLLPVLKKTSQNLKHST